MHRFPSIGFDSLIEIWPIQSEKGINLDAKKPTPPPVKITAAQIQPEKKSDSGKIKCEAINFLDDDVTLKRDPEFYFDIPIVKHYETSADRPQSLASNLLQIKMLHPSERIRGIDARKTSGCNEEHSC